MGIIAAALWIEVSGGVVDGGQLRAEQEVTARVEH